jgi:exonuclease SbcC
MKGKKTMKILHTADLHARRESSREFLISCEEILNAATRHDVAMIAISGDIWHGPTQNSAGSLFPDFIEAIRRMGDAAPVAMIYGTPSHDVEGSLEIFETQECEHGIKILRPGIAYVLKKGRIEELKGDNEEESELLLFGIPEPSKRWIVGTAAEPGSRDADLAAKEAFRLLCTATGCMRERYPHLPAIVLGHGQVEGTTTAHGRMLGTGDGLHFTKDNLKALKAEYIALGDIHQPQHIEGTRAWYAGSAYPLDFGETHKAGCWIVDIHEPGSPVEVIREDFPHPICKHLISHASCAMEIPTMRGQKVWYEVQGTKQELAPLDADIILSRLLAHGAAQGSKVTFDVIGSDPVRASEIRTKKGIEEKLKTWAQASGETLTDSILEKARTLERELETKSLVPTQARYRIDRLILRGAIGLWAKTRKDEIDLNFSAYGPGVLTLIGANGAGKTTILENLHPWPRLLTREGPLRDHFRLADSFRDLYLTDESTSCKYRCLIRMRADIPSGTTEYWLYRDAGNGYAPLPGINGRLEPYQEWTERLFGSLALYQRTAFMAQKTTKNCPDLSTATKGERKELFSELCGINWLEAYREAAKEKEDALDEAIKKVEAKHSLLAGSEARCAALQAEIGEHAALADEKSREEKEIAEKLAKAREQLSEMTKMNQERAQLIHEREEANRRIVALKGKEREYMNDIESLRASLRLKSEMEANITRARAIEERREALAAEKAAHDAKQKQEMKDYLLAMTDYTTKRNKLVAEINELKVEAASLQEQSSIIEKRLSTPLGKTCPACGQMLPPDKLSQQQHMRSADEASLESLKEKLLKLADKKKDIDRTLQSLTPPAYPAQMEFPGMEELKDMSKELAAIDLVRAYDIVRRAEIAEGTIAHLRRELAKLEKEIIKACQNEEDKKAQLDALPVKGNEDELMRTIACLAEELTTTKLDIARAQTRREEAEKQLAEARCNLEEYKSLSATLKAMTKEICEWSLLERALGPDGIQALELDALAPSISAIASRLLAASGNEGRIAIQTLRIAGKGSKQHAIEDFSILYINARGDEQEISTLSGGEAVWVRKAIYDAFELIRAQNTGIQFCSVILDEADGALDHESRLRYMRMIDAAHKESGRYQTIIVTHSLELQDMADMSIAIADLQPQKNQQSREAVPLSA